VRRSVLTDADFCPPLGSLSLATPPSRGGDIASCNFNAICRLQGRGDIASCNADAMCSPLRGGRRAQALSEARCGGGTEICALCAVFYLLSVISRIGVPPSARCRSPLPPQGGETSHPATPMLCAPPLRGSRRAQAAKPRSAMRWGDKNLRFAMTRSKFPFGMARSKFPFAGEGVPAERAG
jgi:hypothetical protein